MSEVEKMYENAGIKRIEKSYCSKGYCIHQPNIKFGANDTCRNCSKGHFYLFPEFTTEKQLKLFLLVTSLGMCEIEDWKEKGFHFAIQRKNIYHTTFLSLSNINFEETIADIINNLWQDLTEEERKQIKEILE